MYMIIFVAIGLTVGKLSGGKFENILNVKLNKIWLLIPVFVCTALRFAGLNGLKLNSIVIFIISSSFMLAFLWFNRKYLGFYIIGFGFLLNSLVMALNNGKMPVDLHLAKRTKETAFIALAQSGKDIKHIFMNSHTKLSILGDRIYIPRYLATIAKPDIASIGDIILGIGLMVIMINFMRTEK